MCKRVLKQRWARWVLVTASLMIVSACAPTAATPTAPPVIVSSPTATLTSPKVVTLTVTDSPASPTASSAPSATPTSVPAKATSTAEPVAEVYAVVGVAIDDVLNARRGAGASHPIVGTLPPHALGVRITGEGQEVDGYLWVPVNYQSVSGWVNSHFLARQHGSAEPAVAATALESIQALKNRDMDALSALAHPGVGVRFSPYTYVVKGEDLVFAAEQLPNLLDDPTVYRWGVFDGTGHPIDLTFAAYYARFIYDVDFALADVVGFDVFVGAGNTINNIPDVYTQAITIEYHFEGFDPAYGGMDWRSLRLVLQEHDGRWYLVGIVHDEWTT